MRMCRALGGPAEPREVERRRTDRPSPSAGQHNSAALDLLQARAGLPDWTIRVHHNEHSPIIDIPQVCP